jgi:hypothetical protein
MFSKKIWLRNFVIVFVFMTLSGMGLKIFIFDGEPIYKVQKPDEKTLARRPVDLLFDNVKNGRWHLMSKSFADEKIFEDFSTKFQIKNKLPGGAFERNLFMLKVTTVIPASKDIKTEYTISATLQPSGKSDFISVKFHTTYDKTSRNYIISDMEFSGDLQTLQTTSSVPVIPSLTSTSCTQANSSGYIYIKPTTRKDASSVIEGAAVLGASPNVVHENVPADYYGTSAIRQEPFQGFEFSYENPKYTACRKISPKLICEGLYDETITDTYYPGNMLTQKDVVDAGLNGTLFSNIVDAEGVLEVSSNGGMVSYPTGFFLDAGFRRLTVLTSKSEIIHYGRENGQYHFNSPTALAVAGDFVYVLDRGIVNKLVIFRYFLNSGINLSYVGTTNLNQDFSWVSDISGYRGIGKNILYAANSHNESVFRYELDNNSGLLKSGGTSTIEYKSVKAHDGSLSRLADVTKIKVNPLSEDNTDIVMVIQHSNEITTFSTDSEGSESSLLLNFRYKMPQNSVPAGIGYNLGNSTFMVTDYFEDKVHLFSSLGAYLGSGGKRGLADDNSELSRPVIISSNNFTNDATEFIVGGTDWDVNKGFKRFFPQADIGKIEVIEKTPIDFDDITNSELIFRFALTAGNSVTSVKLKLNGQIIRTLNGPFYADYHGENFLVSGVGEGGLSGKVQTGWNSYEVEVTGTIPGPSNATLQFNRHRKMEFYFIPSIITDSNFVIGDVSGDFVHDKANNPFYVYKNMLIDGPGDFIIKNGKIVLMPACTLKIAGERVLSAINEDFEFMCGANIAVEVAGDTLKTFKDSNFNGLFINTNMVSCHGSYTGGKGSGSAPSSVLEFISCKFKNYGGKAIHVVEGRATVANCIFENTMSQAATTETLTAAGIAVDPHARLDVRGGKFVDHDIAIDGNGAELYIGHQVNSYKGVKLTPTLFQGNQIGIHGFSSYSEIMNCEFTKNQNAIIDLNGTVDISKNSGNIFKENNQVLIFSNIAGGQSGKNLFLNNNVDITYLVPPGEIKPVEFDFTCNFWLHDNTRGTAIIDFVRNPPYDPSSQTLKFVTSPYLEEKGKGNYTCTGRIDGRVASDIIEEDLLKKIAQQFHQDFSTVVEAQLNVTDRFEVMSKSLKAYSGPLVVGDYPNRWNIPDSYQQALLKNGLYTYLYRSYKSEGVSINPVSFSKAYAYLQEGVLVNSQDHYINFTYDKLLFSKLFDRGKRVVEPTMEFIDDDDGIVLTAFPNPFSDQTTISFKVTKNGFYAIDLYSSNGLRTKTIADKLECQQNIEYTVPFQTKDLAEGLYVVKVYNGDASQSKVIKIIKK